jgi:hypothetical protein
MGAEVTKIEPPGGAPSRHIGPFVDDQPGTARSLNHWYYNGGKKSRILDLSSADGRAEFDQLMIGTDLLIVEGHPLPTLPDAPPICTLSGNLSPWTAGQGSVVAATKLAVL